MKFQVKHAPWFSGCNWQVASCELWRCLQNVIYREKENQFDKNMKKYNEYNVNYANSKRRVFEVGIM